jgi:hypothetical protein
MDTVGNHDEIVATGDLFKQAKRQVYKLMIVIDLN